MPKKKNSSPKLRLTPNQAEYIHQVQRIEKAVLKLSKTEGIYLSSDFLPERPKRITKKALQKLKAIKPKTIEALNKQAFEKGLEKGFAREQAYTREEIKQEFAPRKTIVHETRPKLTAPKPVSNYPEEFAEYDDKVYRRSTEDGNWYEAETGRYAFPAERTIEEIEYTVNSEPEPIPEPLPEPPYSDGLAETPFRSPNFNNPDAYYDDENDAWYDNNGNLLDPRTGEPYDDSLTDDEGMIIYDNLLHEIATASYQPAAGYIETVIDDVTSSIGLNGLANNLKQIGDRVIDLAYSAFHPSGSWDVARNNCKELVMAIRGGNLTATDQFAISQLYTRVL